MVVRRVHRHDARTDTGRRSYNYVCDREGGKRETNRERKTEQKGLEGWQNDHPKPLPLPSRPCTRGADGRHRYFTQSIQSERIERVRYVADKRLTRGYTKRKRLTPFADFQK